NNNDQGARGGRHTKAHKRVGQSLTQRFTLTPIDDKMKRGVDVNTSITGERGNIGGTDVQATRRRKGSGPSRSTRQFTARFSEGLHRGRGCSRGDEFPDRACGRGARWRSGSTRRGRRAWAALRHPRRLGRKSP